MQVNEKNFPYHTTTPANNPITLQNQTKWLINSLKQNKDCKRVKFGEIVQQISEQVNPQTTNIAIYIGLEHLESEQPIVTSFGKPSDVKSMKLRAYKGDVILGKYRVYLRKAAVCDIDAIVSGAIILRANPEKILPNFLPFFVHSDEFMDRVIRISAGSLLPNIKWNALEKQEFHLPPLPIQKQIADLLWSIEHQITATQQTQTALQQLKKKLLHQLFNPSLTDNNNSPLFTLQKEDFKQVKFGEVVRHVKEKADYQTLKRFVAGEHMETDELQIKQWGEITEDTVLGSAFCTKFKAGQILYGSRRTYLRKVAIAHFEGVCANTTFILEPMDANILNRDYLAFMMQGEVFATYSINNSKGSTNPYINFTDLQPFEFNLPSIDKQIATAALFNHLEQCLQEAVALTEALQGLKKGLINSLM